MAAPAVIGSSAPPGAKIIGVGGGGRRVAGANVPAGIPGSTGVGGGPAGRSGIGPDGSGGRPAALRGGAGTESGNSVGGTGAAAGAGIGTSGAGAGAAGGAVAASIVAIGGGTLAGSTGLRAGAGAAVTTSGSRATSRRTPSRSAVSCAVNATRCGPGVGVGRPGTAAKLGYGSSAPGGPGRCSAIAPPSRLCHQSTGFASAIRALPKSAIVPHPASINRAAATAACPTHPTRLPVSNNSRPCLHHSRV